MDIDASYMAALTEISRRLSRQHNIAWYEPDDLYQECMLWGVLRYTSYDKSRPPGPFIMQALTNRIRNIYRDKVHRSDCPCEYCGPGRHRECPDGDGTQACSAYLEWSSINGRKSTLASPGNSTGRAEQANTTGPILTDDPSELAKHTEIYAKLDEELPASLRPYFLRMLAGTEVAPEIADEVRAAVADILGIEYEASP